jgi:hypothetical protein
MGFDITNMIETVYNTIAGNAHTLYLAAIEMEEIQTAIQTYNTAVQALNIYNEAVRHYDAITGNPGWGTIMSALGSRELRNYAPGHFNDLVKDVNGTGNAVWSKYHRLSGAAGRFQTGNRLYLPNDVIANKDTLWASPKSSEKAKKMYEESFNLNKAYSALAETSYDQVEEHIQETNKLIDKIDAADTPSQRGNLTNAFLGDISVNINEGNRMSSAILKRLTDTEIDRMRQVAIDKQAYNQPLVAF